MKILFKISNSIVIRYFDKVRRDEVTDFIASYCYFDNFEQDSAKKSGGLIMPNSFKSSK